MANTLVTPSWVAKEALVLLDNNLVAANLVHRDYSNEFVSGRGETITIRKPNRYTVRTDHVMNTQATVEGSTTVSIDKWAGVDLEFTSKELTFSLTDFSQRVLRPAMVQIANKIDMDVLEQGKYFWNWVGTPGQTVRGWDDLGRVIQRMDEMAMPTADRVAIMSPADNVGLLSNFTGLFVGDVAKTALTRAKLPMVAGLDPYMAQNVYRLTTGTRDNTTPVTNGASQAVSWPTVKSTGTQTLVCAGFDNGATIKAGDVFTLGTTGSGLLAINPVSKVRYDYLQQFVVMKDATADGSGNATLTISPPIITSGAYQTVELTAANTDGLALTFLGTASTVYPQNIAFTKQAIALVTRPLIIPDGVVDAARETYKGISVRVIPSYDAVNDVARWRLDIVYGVKAIYPDLGVRFSGSPSA